MVKKKNDIINLLLPNKNSIITSYERSTITEILPEKIHRLNYIGSKFQLLNWITTNIKEKTEWIFLSYNSESIVSKEKMLDIMKKYGTASVIERNYKRFKLFEYNNDVSIKEYLFCLHKNK